MLWKVVAFTVIIMTTDWSDMSVLHKSSVDAVMCGSTFTLLVYYIKYSFGILFIEVSVEVFLKSTNIENEIYFNAFHTIQCLWNLLFVWLYEFGKFPHKPDVEYLLYTSYIINHSNQMIWSLSILFLKSCNLDNPNYKTWRNLEIKSEYLCSWLERKGNWYLL